MMLPYKMNIDRRCVVVGLGTMTTGAALLSSGSAGATAPASAPGKVSTTVPPKSDGDSESGYTAVGRDISVSFNFDRCIHARFCVLWAPTVFRANVEPWMAPDEERAEDLAAVIRNCPSGALQYTRTDGGPQEAAPPINVVNLRENGPLAFRAQLTLNGEPIGYRATLCRCGMSQHKPYCDRSHVEAHFVASGEADTKDSPPLAVRDGRLDIQPQIDGPLAVTGSVEICCGTGRTIERTTSVTLCRCGHSGNKPFCDGSHVRVGFKAG